MLRCVDIVSLTELPLKKLPPHLLQVGYHNVTHNTVFFIARIICSSCKFEWTHLSSTVLHTMVSCFAGWMLLLLDLLVCEIVVVMDYLNLLNNQAMLMEKHT
jgi:hypothetical protein